MVEQPNIKCFKCKDDDFVGPFPIGPTEIDSKAENKRATEKAVHHKTLNAYRKMGYDRYEVISAWIKEMRKGDVESALYWCRIMLTAGEMQFGNAESSYLIKRLQIFVTEDLCPTETWAIPYAAALSRVCHETHAILWAVSVLTKAKKWWETEEGVSLREMTVNIKSEIHGWHKGEVFNWKIGEWVEIDKKAAKKRRPIPSAAIDVHTYRGKHLIENREKVNEIWSGNGKGIAERAARFHRKNKLKAKDPGTPVLCSWTEEDEKTWLAEEVHRMNGEQE